MVNIILVVRLVSTKELTNTTEEVQNQPNTSARGN